MTRRQLLALPAAGALLRAPAFSQKSFPGVAYRDYPRCLPDYLRELAEHFVLSRSNLTRLADRLEQAGLIERAVAAEDRRGAYCVITAEGRALRKRMWPAYQAAVERYFGAHISEREAILLGATLARVARAAHAGAPDTAAAPAARNPPVRHQPESHSGGKILAAASGRFVRLRRSPRGEASARTRSPRWAAGRRCRVGG